MMHWHWQESCQKVFPPRAKLGMTDGAKFAPILNSTIFLKSDNKHSGTPACLPTQLVLWSNRLLAAAAAIVHTHLFDLATGFSEVQKVQESSFVSDSCLYKVTFHGDQGRDWKLLGFLLGSPQRGCSPLHPSAPRR